jgi:hypothetical protein
MREFDLLFKEHNQGYMVRASSVTLPESYWIATYSSKPIAATAMRDEGLIPPGSTLPPEGIAGGSFRLRTPMISDQSLILAGFTHAKRA